MCEWFEDEQKTFDAPDEAAKATDIISLYMSNYLVFSICWAFGGSMPLINRIEFCQDVAQAATQDDIPIPAGLTKSAAGGGGLDVVTLLDYGVVMGTGKWRQWKETVPNLEIEPGRIDDAQLVIETVDTVR